MFIYTLIDLILILIFKSYLNIKRSWILKTFSIFYFFKFAKLILKWIISFLKELLLLLFIFIIWSLVNHNIVFINIFILSYCITHIVLQRIIFFLSKIDSLRLLVKHIFCFWSLCFFKLLFLNLIFNQLPSTNVKVIF